MLSYVPPTRDTTVLKEEDMVYLQQMFADVDADGSGELSAAELKGRTFLGMKFTDKDFQKADKDRSGYITISELLQFLLPKVPPRDIQRIFATDIPPGVLPLIRKSFQEVSTASGRLSITKLKEKKEKFYGMTLAHAGLAKRFGHKVEEGLTLKDVLMFLYPKLSEVDADRLLTEDIPFVAFLVLKSWFSSLDADDSGQITQAEFSKGAQSIFNGGSDTEFIREAFNCTGGGMVFDKQLFNRLDKDKSGSLSFYELVCGFYPSVKQEQIKVYIKKWGGLPENDILKVYKQEARGRSSILNQSNSSIVVYYIHYEQSKRQVLNTEYDNGFDFLYSAWMAHIQKEVSAQKVSVAYMQRVSDVYKYQVQLPMAFRYYNDLMLHGRVKAITRKMGNAWRKQLLENEETCRLSITDAEKESRTVLHKTLYAEGLCIKARTSVPATDVAIELDASRAALRALTEEHEHCSRHALRCLWLLEGATTAGEVAGRGAIGASERRAWRGLVGEHLWSHFLLTMVSKWRWQTVRSESLFRERLKDMERGYRALLSSCLEHVSDMWAKLKIEKNASMARLAPGWVYSTIHQASSQLTEAEAAQRDALVASEAQAYRELRAVLHVHATEPHSHPTPAAYAHTMGSVAKRGASPIRERDVRIHLPGTEHGVLGWEDLLGKEWFERLKVESEESEAWRHICVDRKFPAVQPSVGGRALPEWSDRVFQSKSIVRDIGTPKGNLKYHMRALTPSAMTHDSDFSAPQTPEIILNQGKRSRYAPSMGSRESSLFLPSLGDRPTPPRSRQSVLSQAATEPFEDFA